MNLFHKIVNHTYIKYFLSYLIIVAILIFGFFFIIKKQLTEYNFEQSTKQAKLQLDNLAEQLDSELSYLLQIDTSLANNINLIKSRHETQDSSLYLTCLELKKYVSATKLIDSIIYMPKNSNKVFSSKYVVQYIDGTFCITKPSGTNITFDPTPYFNNISEQLIFLCAEDTQCLIYFPSIGTGSSYISFYILDMTDLQLQMKTLVDEEMPAIALIDSDKQIITGANASVLIPYLESTELKNGIYQIDNSNSICIHTGIANGFSIVSLISNDYLLHQINIAFTKSYLTLMLLGIVGLFLIFFVMRITYLPLHQLMQRVVPGSEKKHNYLEQLDHVFSETTELNHQLKEKLDNYRLFMQKSLLDSIITSGHPDDVTVLSNIDSLFDTELNKEIFVIQMMDSNNIFPLISIQKYWSEMLPGSDSCMILNSNPNSAIFLINYIGTEPNKEEVLKELLNNFYEEQGYLSAISRSSDSPMDIPALYESVINASSCWPQIPVVDCKSMQSVSSVFTYPYDKLNQLSKSLKENQYSTAKLIVNDLFELIDYSNQPENNIPDFFIRCLLIDMQIAIINCINQSNIKFNSYSDLYFETLYLCRSYTYTEKSEEIKVNTEKLLFFYEQEMSSKTVHATQIQQRIEQSYCQPDFSIFTLADTFQISTAYMSYLVKTNLGQNFSDYLWNLRLNKAKELLKNSEMSIDEISTAIGYYNASSFRRKFKQETGVTPSQYRSKERIS